MEICYLNITSEIPPRDKVYLDGLEQNGVIFSKYLNNSPSLKKYFSIIRWYRKSSGRHNLVWVGYTAHVLVPLVRIFSSKKVVFNALGSMYEGIILSRHQSGPFSFLGIYCWLVDFFAFHSAHVSLVESKAQKEYLQKMFFLRPNKLIVAYTGVEADKFFFDPSLKKLPVFTVLFRGAFLPESGIEYAIEAANILKNEKINFRIIGSGLMKRVVDELILKHNLKNIEWFRDRLPQDELRIRSQETHLSLGQLSSHNRLDRTIPHKAFEAIALKLPYLTARNRAVLEIFTENKNCLCCNPADARDLADQILTAKRNPEVTNKIVEQGYNLYLSNMTSNILADKLLEDLQNYLHLSKLS